MPSVQKASQTRWWDGTTWRAFPIKFLTQPNMYDPNYLTWVSSVPQEVGNFEFTGDAADAWQQNSMGSADTAHYGAGFVYSDADTGLIAGVTLVPWGTGPGIDPRLNLYPLSGTYTMEARLRAERVSAGGSPQPATLGWAAKSDQFTYWTLGTYSTTQAFTVYTRSVTFDGTERWNPRIDLNTGALSQTAVWRLSVDYLRLLDPADETVAKWGRYGNFAVRTSTGWMWY